MTVAEFLEPLKGKDQRFPLEMELLANYKTFCAKYYLEYDPEEETRVNNYLNIAIEQLKTGKGCNSTVTIYPAPNTVPTPGNIKGPKGPK